MTLNNLLRKGALILTGILIVSALAYSLRDDNKKADPPKKPESAERSKDTIDIKDPRSQYVLVNKTNAINPEDYKPDDLVIPNIPVSKNDSTDEQSVREIIRPSLEKMVKDAKASGLDLTMNSGFRSYKSQTFYFNNYVKQSGLEAANKFSAKPGHSEHQTGLAFDLSYTNRKCYLDICFSKTEAGIWLANNAYKYGFILRYPDGKTSITGYQYEPWHFRYVGGVVAKVIFDKKLTYEEYLQSQGLIAL